MKNVNLYIYMTLPGSLALLSNYMRPLDIHAVH